MRENTEFRTGKAAFLCAGALLSFLSTLSPVMGQAQAGREAPLPPLRIAHVRADKLIYRPGEAGILRILENEIRPAVMMDGGDIVFAGYQNGVLKLQLRGSCHHCPSSLVTLKMGIENRLKQEFPEVLSVEAV